MEERLPLYENGAPSGILLRREEGLHTLFSAECRSGQGALRKLWLRGEGGGSLLLGTLLPEEGRWYLQKRVSRSELQRQGLTGAIWGEIVPEGGAAFGQGGGRDVPVQPEDPVIAQSMSKTRGGRWQRMDGQWRLSYPWQVGQPVPLAPLFCFAAVEGGELVFLLNERGYPVCCE